MTSIAPRASPKLPILLYPEILPYSIAPSIHASAIR